MSETISTEPPRAKLFAALAGLQAELPKIAKGETAKVPGKDGKQGYSYSYADLADVSAAIMPLLGKHGLAFTAKPTLTPEGFGLAYKLVHASGEFDDGFYLLPDPRSTAPQQVGSAITYARRYCLLGVTGAAPCGDDDDAAVAQDWHQRSAADAFESAAPARGATPQAAAPATRDGAWLDDALNSAGTLPTVDKCREMWRQSAGKARAGEITKADAGRLQGILGARMEDLGRAVVDPDHPWAPKIDGLTSAEEAADALAELTGLFKSGGIDETRANQARDAILIRFPQAAEEARRAA